MCVVSVWLWNIYTFGLGKHVMEESLWEWNNSFWMLDVEAFLCLWWAPWGALWIFSDFHFVKRNHLGYREITSPQFDGSFNHLPGWNYPVWTVLIAIQYIRHHWDPLWLHCNWESGWYSHVVLDVRHFFKLLTSKTETMIILLGCPKVKEYL